MRDNLQPQLQQLIQIWRRHNSWFKYGGHNVVTAVSPPTQWAQCSPISRKFILYCYILTWISWKHTNEVLFSRGFCAFCYIKVCNHKICCAQRRQTKLVLKEKKCYTSLLEKFKILTSKLRLISEINSHFPEFTTWPMAMRISYSA